MARGTIETNYQATDAGTRVFFSCPVDGYNADDLDALIVAARIARRKLTEAPVAASIDNAYELQLERMAAPS